MLKKVLIGIAIFIILAIAGIGGYIYMMDWNKHKDVVAERFSQITGLRASIEGDLKVDLLPTPKFSANGVRFFKHNAPRDPLVTVKDITATVELLPMFHQKFIIKSMTLTHATVNVTINEKGVSNWDNISASSEQSGDIEVSFNDVRLNDALLNYNNLQDKEEFSLPNISATVNASTIKGPYKTSGRLLYNNNEIKFQGLIAKSKDYQINMTFENAPTGSKGTIEGTLGAQSKGTITFRTAHLAEISKILFTENAIKEQYNDALDFSFQYDYNRGTSKLNNFVIKYDNLAAGSGSVSVKNLPDEKEFAVNLDMSYLDLNIIENIGKDILDHTRQGNKFAETALANYNGIFDLKAAHALYHGAEVLNVNVGLALQNGLLSITRFGLNMPGNTNIKLAGAINLNEDLRFQMNQSFETADLRQFVSVFGIDLAKLARPENKKSIFKHAEATLNLAGDMNQLMIEVPQATVDTTTLNGKIGFVLHEDQTFVIVSLDGSKVLFDKYVQALPQDSAAMSLKDKFIYQINLIPWNHELNVEAAVTLKSAVYNNIPLENISLEFNSVQNSLNIKKLLISNIAGANLNLNFNAENVYTDPYFNEFAYDVKTDNFPQFATTVGIQLSDLKLLNRKLFASQGALSGSFDDLNLSSVLKFSDVEFLYTGSLKNTENDTLFDGDIELKSNNFSNLVSALNFDYKPDIAVTPFSLAGKIKGTTSAFDVSDLTAYLSANSIKGSFGINNKDKIPELVANLDFDKFDADRLFNLNKKTIFKQTDSKENDNDFVAKPLLDDTKINYDLLKKSNFDIKATAKNLVYEGTNYNNAQLNAVLDNGELRVANFSAANETSSVKLKFNLNSNDMPKIGGSYDVQGFTIPSFVGTIYALQKGKIKASGDFNSLATSPNDFFENLNSHGNFELSDATVKGWDFALIKFELEQRDTIKGFEDTVLQSLRNGKSQFSKIHGPYEITKGILIAKNIVWESPVINLNMNLDFNFNDWLFTAVFNGVYLNASFSDVLKFTFDGHLDNPNVAVDLSESIARIGKTQKMIDKMKVQQDAMLKSKLAGKVSALQKAIVSLQQEISRMTLDIVNFRPVTKNKAVNNVYNANLDELKSAEQTLNHMSNILKDVPDENTLREIETNLSAEQAKLQFIPKVLEENFVVDSKYIFEDTFNKIAWVYNVAQNNSGYYKSLSDVYLEQLNLSDTTANPISPEKITQIQNSTLKVADNMDKISNLHDKVRDNYLVIIDATQAREMKENNEIAEQALKTLLGYVAEMNNNIVASFDLFREALDIKSRDYEQYMVYPPENPADIDISQPTVRIVEEKNQEEAKSQPAVDSAPTNVAPSVAAPEEENKPDNIENAEQTSSLETDEAKEDKKKTDIVENDLIGKDETVSADIPAETSSSDFALEILPSSSGLENSLTVSSSDNQPVNTLNTISVIEPENDIAEELVSTSQNALDIQTLPDANTLALTSQSSNSNSAIEKALQTDIDNTLVLSSASSLEPNSTILEHTKTATDDVAEKIENLKPAVITDNKKEPVTNESSLKVNPVIAMDIGQEAPETSIKITFDNDKKSGFKKVATTKELSDNKSIIEPLNQTKNLLNNILKNEKSDALFVENDLEFRQNDSFSADNKPTKYVFKVKSTSFNPQARGVVDKQILRYKKENTHPDFIAKKYISDASNTLPIISGGIVEKRILIGKNIQPETDLIEQKYLYASNSIKPDASGTVGKQMFLGVK